MKRTSTHAVLLVLTFLLVGCGMSKDVLERGKQAGTAVETTKRFVNERESGYPQLLTGERQWLARFAERENWKGKLAEAKAAVSTAESTYIKLKPLLDKNSSSSEQAVRGLILSVHADLKKAEDSARRPATRAGELEAAKKNAAEVNAKARTDYAAYIAVAQPLAGHIRDAQQQYDNRKDDIAKRYAVFLKTLNDVNVARETVTTQFGNHLANRETDYPAFADAAIALGRWNRAVNEDNTRIRSELSQLGETWSRTLIDMKQRFYVRVAQVSWDEYYDFPTEHPYSREWVEVTEAVFDTLDDLPEEANIAAFTSGMLGGGLGPVAPIGWDILGALRLNPNNAKDGWHSGDDEAEYWIEGYRVDNFHRYRNEVNGAVVESDWIPVSAEDFEEYYNDLGMTLKSKPFGQFNDEAEDEPVPAGMSYVGNPRYGRWRTGSGGDFWEFYGRYALYRDLLGDSHPGYSRTEWNEYRAARERDEPYYGGTNTAPRYGSGSQAIQTQARWQSTHFSRTGGFHTAQSEIRTAGVHTRGGGPGGGGK